MITHKKHQDRYQRILPFPRRILVGTAVLCALSTLTIVSYLLSYEQRYRGKVYPVVVMDSVHFGNYAPAEVENYWKNRNEPFVNAIYEFEAEGYIATISGQELKVGYDALLSAKQAYLVGRSGQIFTDLRSKFFNGTVEIRPLFRWDTGIFEQAVDTLAQVTDVPPQDALFSFSGGRVSAFKPSLPGKRLDIDGTRRLFEDVLAQVPLRQQGTYRISVPVVRVDPDITTDKANSFGIREKIGTGYSEFSGSIPGRIHNVALAASKFNGVLIAPGETFSFNKVLGDVSAATGYQQAYIIKSGRTVLGDGGGVCQVSTTMFRAALNAGLPVPERQAHAYRVHYYEEGGYKPGLDATVFEPTVDLKVINNTPTYILIQTKTDLEKKTLTFELYGQSDGRKAEIFNHIVWDSSPPPPPIYQDDPTLPKDTLKQVDWAAWGAKASFQYRVTRENETLTDTKFLSVFRPWQAVYLKGIME
ncbi:hypothetical protein A2Z33_03095 [Candidatus Gottesmanbacteria bacterium RBG_16_52_11]|uniref:YoaR-like putative peptidoglycan binding domain-containing protein n=1 Tax=Candidatus Gottesmanbacteria bacterium RBG_16_52_11 TaxID=1798374 RepID=A0A1F5YVJ7_9BACT|nr:MAG: hypothetical protein A2Z33_03095 [Candidatus Gottesmanbacteria bacterium RBG_16_52_11]